MVILQEKVKEETPERQRKWGGWCKKKGGGEGKGKDVMEVLHLPQRGQSEDVEAGVQILELEDDSERGVETKYMK